MRTPSLRGRVTITGVASFAALLLLLDVSLFLFLRQQLEQTVTEVLAARADIASALGAGRSPAELRDGLEAAGIPAIVRTDDGEELLTSPLTVRAGESPPVSPGLPLAPVVSRTVEVGTGTSIEVLATLAGVRATLRDLVIGEIVVSLAALVAAAALLRRASDVALGPLDTVVATADRIAAGDLGERLRPDHGDTELGRMARSFDRMLDSLQAAVHDARHAEGVSRRFLADAAHQLRTPVAALQASAEALPYETDPDEQRRIVGNCIREARRIARLLRSLLLVARLDQGVASVHEPVDIAGIVQEEVDRATDRAPHLTVAAEPTASGAVVLEGDRDALREALANLLDNACRHASSRVTASVVAAGDDVQIVVADDGPGLEAHQVERAFERFSSLDGRGGSGLGLPIARTVAVSHGGTLVWDGDAFVLTLPRQTVPTG